MGHLHPCSEPSQGLRGFLLMSGVLMGRLFLLGPVTSGLHGQLSPCRVTPCSYGTWSPPDRCPQLFPGASGVPGEPVVSPPGHHPVPQGAPCAAQNCAACLRGDRADGLWTKYGLPPGSSAPVQGRSCGAASKPLARLLGDKTPTPRDIPVAVGGVLA